MLARRSAGHLVQRWTRTATHASTSNTVANSGMAISDTPRTDFIAQQVELPPKSTLPATFHAVTHGHPAALIHLRSHHLPLLNLFLHFAACAADALAIPLSRPVMLPRQRRLWTVPRSPFVHKKSQENFERIVHKRVLKAWDTNPQIIDLWEEYLKMHSLAGVGMRIVKWERLPLDVVGSQNRKQLEEAKTNSRKVAALGQKIINKTAERPQTRSNENSQDQSSGKVKPAPAKKTATEILKQLSQTPGRRGRMSNSERMRLEKQARKEELLRVALEKRAARPDRVEDSLAELDSTVKRALKAIPRYEAIRPTYSASDDAEAALQKDLEMLRIQEREEAELERQRVGRIRAEMEIPTVGDDKLKINLFAGLSNDADEAVVATGEPTSGITERNDEPIQKAQVPPNVTSAPEPKIASRQEATPQESVPGTPQPEQECFC